MDIFKQLGITDEFGNPMSEENLNPLMGYQIVHKDTGRILPHTQRYEIMGADYATNKMLSITCDYSERMIEFPFEEFIFEPVYMSQLDDSQTGFLLLYTEKDEQQFGLFR